MRLYKFFCVTYSQPQSFVCKQGGINNLQERRTDDQTANALGPHVICKKVPMTTCSHKLIIISELNVNVIPAIQWKGKIILASTPMPHRHPFNTAVDGDRQHDISGQGEQLYKDENNAALHHAERLTRRWRRCTISTDRCRTWSWQRSALCLS